MNLFGSKAACLFVFSLLATLATPIAAFADEAIPPGEIQADDPAESAQPQPKTATQAAPPVQTPETPVILDGGPTLTPQAPRFRDWGGTISANIPHPIFLELEHRFNPKWSMGLGGGGIALDNLTIGNIPIKLNMAAIDARVRWHPWSGSFFLGLALGFQKFSGAGSDNIPITINTTTVNINTTITAQITSAYLTPHLGWLWIFDSGFTMGVDFGIQLPAGPKTTFDISTNNNLANIAIDVVSQTQQYKALQTQVDDAGNKLGKIPLPYFTVFRVGWMF